jgi:predicted amidohydrolase
LTLGVDGAAIRRFINAIEADARALIKEISTLSVWGKIAPNDVWEMTYLERVVLSEVVKEYTDTMYGKKGIARSR